MGRSPFTLSPGSGGSVGGMRAMLLAVVAACGASAAAPGHVENKMPASTCTLAITNPGGGLAVNGVALPDFRTARLRKVLGEPDRIERVTSRQRYEEFGDGELPPTSELVEIADTHYVYDRYGLVFLTNGGNLGHTPTLVRVFFAHAREFDNTEAPAAIPDGGRCAVTINGVALDPEVDLRPAGVTYQTARAPLFGTTFGFTSIATVIDRLYTDAGTRHVQIFLDAPATGRAAYLEVR